MALREIATVGRELFRAALYGVTAALRVAGKVAGAGVEVADALAKERQNFDSHKAAARQRVAADRAAQDAREIHGEILGWYLGPNENHCEICPPLAGNNFYADNPPSEGSPGGVHPNCKCRAGAPHPGGELIGGIL